MLYDITHYHRLWGQSWGQKERRRLPVREAALFREKRQTAGRRKEVTIRIYHVVMVVNTGCNCACPVYCTMKSRIMSTPKGKLLRKKDEK